MEPWPSTEWVRHCDRRLRAAAVTGDPLCIQHIVGAEGDLFEYYVEVDRSGARAGVGTAADPSVTFSQSYETARAIRRGELAAGEAVLLGRVEICGDASVFLTHRTTLDAIEAVMASVN
jgi:putative sterol carrier protein